MAGNDESRGLHVGWLLLLVLLLGIGLVRCGDGADAPDDAAPDDVAAGDAVLLDAATAGDLASLAGQRVAAFGIRVHSVPADEGFWVAAGAELVWVQLLTGGESPYTVRAGGTVSFTGSVVAHDAGFPARVGATEPTDAQRLTAQGAHVAVDVDALRFAVG
jgi:hypothetical protein